MKILNCYAEGRDWTLKALPVRVLLIPPHFLHIPSQEYDFGVGGAERGKTSYSKGIFLSLVSEVKVEKLVHALSGQINSRKPWGGW